VYHVVVRVGGKICGDVTLLLSMQLFVPGLDKPQAPRLLWSRQVDRVRVSSLTASRIVTSLSVRAGAHLWSRRQDDMDLCRSVYIALRNRSEFARLKPWSNAK